jgi:hypothetical protein
VNERLREELLEMKRRDLDVRAALLQAGELFDTYHPRMEAVHRAHAERFAAILDEHGWPRRSLVGDDGAEAAWLVVQHAIGAPALQRRAHNLLAGAVAAGEAEPWTLAYLDDRIRTFEGRPQRYGTQFDWDDEGKLSPLPIEDPDSVDDRRAELGLEALDRRVRELRDRAAREGERPPTDRPARRRQFDTWLQEVGWR